MTTLLQKAQQLVAADTIKPQRILIYGESGAGKTTLAAQLARQFKVHWFDLENGHQRLFTALPKECWDNLTLYEVEDTPENTRAAKCIDAVIRPTAKYQISAKGEVFPASPLKPECSSFDATKLTSRDVIVIDSGTQFSASVMAYALAANANLDYAKKEFGHYDKQGFILDNFLLRMKQMPCHIVLITHEEVIENINGSKQIQPVLGTRNFAKRLPRAFDHIIYLYRKNNKHNMTSSSTHSALIMARSRDDVDVKNADDFLELMSPSSLKKSLERGVSNIEFTSSDTPVDMVMPAPPNNTLLP